MIVNFFFFFFKPVMCSCPIKPEALDLLELPPFCGKSP